MSLIGKPPESSALVGLFTVNCDGGFWPRVFNRKKSIKAVKKRNKTFSVIFLSGQSLEVVK